MIKDTRNFFRLKKEIKGITCIILRDIQNLFEHEEEENYYKSVRVKNFWSNNSTEYKSIGDINKRQAGTKCVHDQNHAWVMHAVALTVHNKSCTLFQFKKKM